MESPRNKSEAALADRSHRANQGTTAISTKNLKKKPTSGSERKLSQLSCAKYGGPSDAAASEMVYWEDIEIDAKFISPFKRKDTTQYLTFEPDLAGFNNVRMGVETVVALAHAMGKTLIVPPDRTIWAIDSAENEQKNAFSFDEILHLDSIKIEHPGLNIISMEEFLSEVAIKEAKFKKPGETQVLYPPNNKTKWDGEELSPLWEYLRTIGLVKEWNPDECVALFPSSRDEKDLKQVEQMFNDIIGEANGRPKPKVSNYDGKPLPVDSPAEERLREILGGREKACPYDKEMQDTALLHFKEDWTRDIRFLTHFYGLLFFHDWKQDLWTKRFIRDHVHFNDEIVCAAARVVEAIRKRAKERHPETNPNGDFDTLHVRRNDWATQFPAYSVSSDALFEVTESELIPGRTVFIATDERDKEYFRPLTNVYDVVYLDNFVDELGELNTNFYVFVDQLVAARGRVFFGVYLSTFTGYINRLRGYYSVKEKRHGYHDGIIESYHYAQLEDKNMYRKYHAFSIPPWSREYPIAWRDLDYGIEALYNSYSGEAKIKL
eukprot:CAMPEP_0172420092 /NCGR_PEP_ID=MMETSP1064-20121228/6487_1 /TAXON_ID=202472 /ORGANISM="Aulacoseira subarctica , Strain CCAP 1002/5" /LENGTH=548 /DNA_ID=CAMNT_0013159883 /DNA_START=192 /DNA_END=1838 /DNA_ORIENTATION=+